MNSRLNFFRLRLGGTIVSFSFWSLLLTPVGFLRQVNLRFRISDRIAFLKKQRFRSNGSLHRGQLKPLYIIFSNFHLMKAWLLRSESERRVSRKVQLDVLHSAYWQPADSIRILYLLNSSEPFTSSGYTVRTQKIVSEIEQKVEVLRCMTRLGYPAIIGKIPAQEIVNGIRLSIPCWIPRAESARIEKQVSIVSQYCEAEGINLLHTTTDFTNALVASRVARRLEIPWIYEVRGEPYNTWLMGFSSDQRATLSVGKAHRLFKEKEMEAARAASAVVVLSEISKKSLVLCGVEESKILVLPNSIDSVTETDPELDFNARDFLGLPNDSTLVGAITSIVEYEGLDYLVKAVDLLPQDVHVVVAGSGSDLERLKHLARTLNSPERVHFVGRRPQSEIRYWYEQIDVFAVPRIDVEVCRNVTPIKPLVALQVGTPVVASDLPALREVTGGFAKYVRPMSVSDLAAGIVEVLKDPALWTAESEWLTTRSWLVQGDKLIDLYRSLLRG